MPTSVPRAKSTGVQDLQVLADVTAMSVNQVEEMCRYLAIANYEDRFVVPSAHREDAMSARSPSWTGCGFSPGSGCRWQHPTPTCSVARRPTTATSIKTVQLWEE